MKVVPGSGQTAASCRLQQRSQNRTAAQKQQLRFHACTVLFSEQARAPGGRGRAPGQLASHLRGRRHSPASRWLPTSFSVTGDHSQPWKTSAGNSGSMSCAQCWFWVGVFRHNILSIRFFHVAKAALELYPSISAS